MGQKIRPNYPTFVDTHNIVMDPELLSKDDEYPRRFSLNIPFNDRKGTRIAVILKNPSDATKDVCDVTVNRVVNYIHTSTHPVLRHVARVTIVNLMASSETDSTNLSSIISTKGFDYVVGNDGLVRRNDDVIRNAINAAGGGVILAWGNSPKGLTAYYKSRVNQVLKTVLENHRRMFYVDCLSAQGHPKHGQIWGYDDELKECTIKPVGNGYVIL